jgi:acyl carrier protein
MTTETIIERFIIDEISAGARTSIGLDEPLIASGILDSLALLRLITFIEQQFDLTIGDGDVGPENFDTVRRIAAFLDQRKKG